MNKKAFSIFEIIFVLVILAIISAIAIPKLFQNKLQTNIIKTKTDIALIKEAIKKDFNKALMKQNSNEYIQKLDNAMIDKKNEELFIGIEDRKLLEYALISTASDENKVGSWIKQSDNTYEVFLDTNIKVQFTYDNTDGSFSCDKNEEYCMELAQ